MDLLCIKPYACDYDMLMSQLELFACRGDESGGAYFGKPPTSEGRYSEFLQSIVDTSMLGRSTSPTASHLAPNTVLETDTFIDSRTTEVEILLLTYSADYSLVTQVTIRAQLGAQVRVEASLEHFSA